MVPEGPHFGLSPGSGRRKTRTVKVTRMKRTVVRDWFPRLVDVSLGVVDTSENPKFDE